MKWKIVSPLLPLLLIDSSSIAESTELKKASFIPQWALQAQFAALYVAHEKGLYRKARDRPRPIAGSPRSFSFCLLFRVLPLIP